MEGDEQKKTATVCVTGAGGYVASWLVKILLERGYRVHGTVRDPSDQKNAHLKKLEGATENLHLFKAELLDYEAIQAAIAGCEGVFHAASPVPTTKVPNPEVELIEPAVKGTLNVLKACSNANVKRVVVVSSLAAVSRNPDWPTDKIKDETCWSDKEYCKNTEEWYCLSKTMAEEDALRYAKMNGLDVITVCPSMVIGPLLQPTVNFSSLFLMSFMTGKTEEAGNQIWHFVDVRDVAEALILVYKKPEASGRYICAPHPMKVSALVDMLKSKYPDYNYPKSYKETPHPFGLVTSGKLKALGWNCRTLEESLVDSVEYYKKAGILNKN